MEAEDAEVIFCGEVEGEFGPLACFESEGDGLGGRGVVGPGDFSLSAFGGEDAEGNFCGAAELTGASAKERIGGGTFEGDYSVFDGGLAVPGFPALKFFAEGIVFGGVLFVAAIFADTD